MKYWVVKSASDVFAEDSYDEIPDPSSWWTGKPPKDWSIGDRLFFWINSPAKRIVELGVLEEVLSEKDDLGRTIFNVKFLTPLLKNQITIEQLKVYFSNDMPSFLKRGPAGTLFPLTKEQGEKLRRLVILHNPKFKNIWSNSKTNLKIEDLPDIDISAIEGKLKLVSHLKRERNQKIISAKKAQVLNSVGKLKCEVCDFDFEETYGKEIGRGYCEVHHRRPISEYIVESKTKLEDLAIICSNCHRMIHRTKPLMSVERFRKLLKK